MPRLHAVRAPALAALAALLLPCPAAAGLHQICFKDDNVPNEPLAVSAHCRSDSGNESCTITTPAGFTLLSSGWSAGSRSETYRVPSATDTYHLAFQFSGGTVRGCTVEMGIPYQYNGGMPDPAVSHGTLVGYTTDISGHVTTGVWRASWSIPQGTGSAPLGLWSHLDVAPDFVVTGGGAVGAEWPNGAYLTDLETAGPQVWESGTMENGTVDAYEHEGYGIGMKIEGLSYADLRAVVNAENNLESATASHPSVTFPAPLPDQGLIIGGGASASPGPPWRSYLTVDAPALRLVYGCRIACQPVLAIDGWMASAKDHIVSAPGWTTAHATIMAPVIFIGIDPYRVEVSVKTATSAVAQHPSATVEGTMGEYALTGVGASVDWQSYGWAGNMLWKLVPRPDIAGAEAASKDHGYYSPASVTVYALGLKLVPIPWIRL